MLNSPVVSLLREIHARHAPVRDGKVADYIPELSKADPSWFGICIATRDGHVYEVGDSRKEFTIQSISKALVYGLALEDRGEEHMLARVGVEPSGDAFNAISLRPGTGVPLNPLINAGAIASAGQIRPLDGQSRIDRILRYLSRCSGRELAIDQSVYRSESDTGHRNRAIGWMLRNFSIIEEDPLDTLETYFQQCAIRVNCRDLALMGATLANRGRNPLTNEQAISEDVVDNVLSVMATCGMYDFSGEWIYRVGLPAKSGVGGGIMAVLPGQIGIGVFSPPLDAQGNSVRGVRACIDMTRELALHQFNSAAAPRPALRHTYNGGSVSSRRRRPGAAAAALRTYGSRIRVLELEGHLTFSTVEPVLRALVRHAPYSQHLILDLRHCGGADEVSLRLLRQLSETLQVATPPVSLQFAGVGELLKPLREAGFPTTSIHSDVDDALEFAEEQLLESLPGKPGAAQPPVPVESCYAFQACLPADLEWLRSRLLHRSFVAGQTIVSSGADSDSFFVILSGTVEVRLPMLARQGSRRLNSFTAGMTFGEMGFLDGSTRSADVVALEPVECVQVTRTLFDSLDAERPSLKIALLTQLTRLLSTHLRRTNTELAALRG